MGLSNSNDNKIVEKEETTKKIDDEEEKEDVEEEEEDEEEDFEEPVSPPPSDLNDVIIVEDEETSREDNVEKREDSGEIMAEVDMERNTESPPEARHRLPLLVAPREPTPSLRRPMPPRPLLSQSPNLPTTAV